MTAVELLVDVLSPAGLTAELLKLPVPRGVRDSTAVTGVAARPDDDLPNADGVNRLEASAVALAPEAPVGGIASFTAPTRVPLPVLVAGAKGELDRTPGSLAASSASDPEPVDVSRCRNEYSRRSTLGNRFR